MTPTLSTNRLLLRPYYAGMVTDDHVRWLNDPEVVRYSEQRHKRHTIESIHAYVNGVNTTHGSYIWAITPTAFEREALPVGQIALPPIGTITAHIDQPNGVANVGILIGEKDYWGKGYGQESWITLCNWLFATGIRKIEMGCHYENKAMRNLALTCGMYLEGVRHDHFVVDGKPQHLLLYAKMRPAHESVTSESLRERDSQDSA